MKKILGYISALAGVFGLAIMFEPVKKAIGIGWDKFAIADTTATIISAALIIFGIIILYQNRGHSQPAEVPIFHGKNVVGFRKIK